MPEHPLTTRIDEDTFWQLKAEAVETRRSMAEIVEAALRHYLGMADATEADA